MLSKPDKKYGHGEDTYICLTNEQFKTRHKNTFRHTKHRDTCIYSYVVTIKSRKFEIKRTGTYNISSAGDYHSLQIEYTLLHTLNNHT